MKLHELVDIDTVDGSSRQQEASAVTVKTMTSFRTIKSVEKTLRVIEEMNLRQVSKVKELADALKVPAPTVVRILETLETLGFVRHIDRRTGYCITERVSTLSAGYHGVPAVFDKARLALEDLTEKLLWPAALATLDRDVMVVRYSTIPRSPLSHSQSTLNKRLDLLSRAHGRAYLAYCHDLERRHLYQTLSQTRVPKVTAGAIARKMAPTLRQVRLRGVAIRASDLDPETTTLAVPIIKNERVIATIGLTVFKGARPDMQHLVESLLAASAEIGSSG